MLSPLHGQHVAACFHSRANHNVRAINGSANIKVNGLEQIYLKYQTHASTARELLYFTIRLCSVKHDCSVKSMRHGLYAIIYTEGKSLAIYFADSQFRTNRTFNFIVSKYMLTNVQEYDDINRLTFQLM